MFKLGRAGQEGCEHHVLLKDLRYLEVEQVGKDQE